jgi:hypothetical protein
MAGQAPAAGCAGAATTGDAVVVVVVGTAVVEVDVGAAVDEPAPLGAAVVVDGGPPPFEPSRLHALRPDAARAATKTATIGRRRTGPILAATDGQTIAADMTNPSRTPTCVWRIRPELVVALDEQFGEPVDAYVNGSQVWLRDDGPGGIAIEWRLHPVAGYKRPAGVGTDEVFPATALAIAMGDLPPAPAEQLWDGLEAFPAYGEEVEPATLAAAATASLGLTPDAAGLADHRTIGDEWERSGGKVSIIAALLQQLGPPPPSEPLL